MRDFQDGVSKCRKGLIFYLPPSVRGVCAVNKKSNCFQSQQTEKYLICSCLDKNIIIVQYLVDHLGSTNVMIDSTGTLVERSLYYPFGSYRSGIADEKYGFTGKEFDSDTGLYYYGARYYNPEIFVFTQADSVLPDVYDPQALNRYSYCLNNPLKYEDPDGHVAVVDDIVLGVCIGIAVGGAVGLIGGAINEAIRQESMYGKIEDVDAIYEAAAKGGIEGIVVGAVTGVTAGALAITAGVEISTGIIAYASMSTAPFSSMIDGAIEYELGISNDESLKESIMNKTRMANFALSSTKSFFKDLDATILDSLLSLPDSHESIQIQQSEYLDEDAEKALKNNNNTIITKPYKKTNNTG